MAGALRKTMEILGFAETDDRYDDYGDYQDDHQSGPSVAEERDDRSRGAEVTPLPQRTSASRVVSKPEMSELTRITTIHPRTYNEAKEIGESFRNGTPVILNLTDMEDSDAKRLVDFAAGLAFGLHGSIERVTARVFLLSPAHVQVDDGTPERARPDAEIFNQS